MKQHNDRKKGASRVVSPRVFGAILLLAVAGAAGSARAEEPPITSLQDAACRAEAKAKVFQMPDPLNLGLREIGKQLYFGCMKRSGHAAKGHHPGKKKRHRHRRR